MAKSNDLPEPPEGEIGWPWTQASDPLPEKMPDGSGWPSISIVTSSYNQGEFIEETIRSVLLQGYPNLRYIIIDGASTDATQQIIKGYAQDLFYWVSEPDEGQAHAINKGFDRVDADIFCYLNSDDLLEAGILEKVAQDYRTHPDPDNFFAAYAVRNFEDNGSSSRIVKQAEGCQLNDWIACETSMHQPGVFWSAKLYYKIGGFDPAYHYAFDRKFFMKILSLGVSPMIDNSIIAANFRMHEESKTITESHRKGESEFISEVFSISDEFISGLGASERKSVNRRRTSNYIYRVLENEDSFFIPQLRALLFSLSRRPQVITSRFFWGALKKTLLQRASGNTNA